jgi:adenosylhomocysteine nucleosidase
MIGIIGAMEVEIETIVSALDNKKSQLISTRTFYTGTFKNKEVVVVKAGIGKVNAAITTTLLIEHFDIDCVINIGVAGGQNGVKHKDVVISSEVLYHDVDVTNFGTYVHGQMPGHTPTFVADQNLLDKTTSILEDLDMSYKIGLIASGDQFVYSKEKIEAVNAIYPSIYAIEMEAAAIAHTCQVFAIPFIVYRSISDVLDDPSQAQDFNLFVKDASDNAFAVISHLFEVL